MKKTMFFTRCWAAALAALALSSTLASATLWNLAASLDGLQEVPPNVSPGFGNVSLTLDDVSGAVTIVSGSYNFLTANVTAAHIHGLAAPGVNAGVLIGLTPTGGTSGTLSGGGTLSALNTTGMLNGNTYVNVHSTAFGGGEIRGQITVVPEPTTFTLAGLGLAALWCWRAARRRA